MFERTCTVDECESIAVARDWCATHYNAWRRYGSPTQQPPPPRKPKPREQRPRMIPKAPAAKTSPSKTRTKRAAVIAAVAAVDSPQPDSVTYTITVPQSRPYMTVSKLLNDWQRVEEVRLWRTAGWAAVMMDNTVPRDEPLGFVRIIATVHIANNLRQDVSNFFPTFKACIDGFVDAGILDDDSDAHVIGPDPRRGYTDPPRIVFTLEELLR